MVNGYVRRPPPRGGRRVGWGFAGKGRVVGNGRDEEQAGRGRIEEAGKGSGGYAGEGGNREAAGKGKSHQGSTGMIGRANAWTPRQRSKPAKANREHAGNHAKTYKPHSCLVPFVFSSILVSKLDALKS